jgi:phytoene synthase
MVVEMAVRAFVRRPEIEALPPFARRHKPRLALAAVEMPFTDEARAIARLLLFSRWKNAAPAFQWAGVERRRLCVRVRSSLVKDTGTIRWQGMIGKEPMKIIGSSEVWSETIWDRLEQRAHRLASAATSEAAAWKIIVRQARAVLRTYSTSFFIVTRFLPPAKRDRVEAIYAAVRYPDEIVDTFPLAPEERVARLDRWAADYETALAARSIKEALRLNVPCFLASFTRVVREAGIPPEHYRSFLAAMHQDVRPRRYSTLDDLIESYVYGSAIVVGYFLTYVYGSSTKQDFERALASARHLGIALQLTNFLRDVAEDQRRGRLYLPLELLRAEGIEAADATDPQQTGRVPACAVPYDKYRGRSLCPRALISMRLRPTVKRRFTPASMFIANSISASPPVRTAFSIVKACPRARSSRCFRPANIGACRWLICLGKQTKL